MWMSLMTSGVKIFERPRTVRFDGAVSSVRAAPSWLSACSARSCCGSAMWSPLEDELALGRLEVVVVVELLAAHELLQLGRLAQPVDGELARDNLGLRSRPPAGSAAAARGAPLAPAVDPPAVHRAP